MTDQQNRPQTLLEAAKALATQATQMIGTLDAAKVLRQRAEKAEAECREQRSRAESENDRNRDLSEKLIAAHGKTHAESERAKKAEAELAKLRDAIASSHSMPAETPPDELVGTLWAGINGNAKHLSRAGYALPLKVGKVLPLVVDELLRLRAEAVTAKEVRHYWRDRGIAAEKEAVRLRAGGNTAAVEPEVGIVRDPVTGWTFATYRRLLEALGGKS